MLHKLFLGELNVIIQVTKPCAYPLNKQLLGLSSALYLKFTTFTVLLLFFFSMKSVWFHVYVHGHLCCVMCIHQSECVLSFDWSRLMRTFCHHVLTNQMALYICFNICTQSNKDGHVSGLHPSHESNQTK